MNLLNRLTLRGMKLNRKRTIVTVIGVMLSCAMIFAVSTLVTSFQDLLVQRAKETDGSFHASFYGVRSDHVKYIAGNPYTEEFMLSGDLGFAVLDGAKVEAKPYLLVKEYDHTAFEHMPVKLTEGRFPAKAGEMVISEEILAASEANYAVGDTITLDIGRRVVNGAELDYEPFSETETFEPLVTRSYTITGLIAKPHFERFSPLPAFTAIAYLDSGSLGAAGTVNVSILGSNPRQIYDKAPGMAENAGADRVEYNNELLRYLGVSGGDRVNAMLNSVALIVILLIVVGSVAVIYNAFAISVSERKKQFGMLASVGATPGQIRQTVFFEGALLGLIAIPAGILAGMVGIGITLNVVNRLMIGAMFSEDVALRMVVSPVTLAVTVFFVALVIFISAYIPAKRASQTAPIDAIRLTGDIKIKGRQLKTSKLTRLLFGIEGELALKNLKRNRRRYRATVFSLFISIVLFITFSSLITYGFQSMAIYYEDRPYNVSVVKFGVPLEDQLEFYAQIAALNGVDRYAVVRTINAWSGLERSRFSAYSQEYLLDKGALILDEDGGYQVHFSIVTLGDNAFEAYVAENRLALDDFGDTGRFKGILVNNGIIRNGVLIDYTPFDLREGDILRLEEFHAADGSRPASIDIEIGAITENLPFGVCHQDNIRITDNASYSVFIMVVDDASFAAMARGLGEDPQSAGRYARLFIQSDDSAALVDGIRALPAAVADQSFHLQDFTAMQEEAERMKTVYSIFLYGFVILITLIGVTNIFNTISTNVALRRREFAMLKSVGLTPKSFNKIINFESTFYGLKALLYGLPASILISVLLYRAFGNLFVFEFILPWKEILTCVAGVFVIVSITMLHAGARLKKDNIVDALKEENL